MLEQAITSLLNAIVGHNRIYHHAIPNNTPLPAISYQIINSKPVTTLDNTGYRSATVQINSVANSLKEAQTIAKSVRTTLPTQRGLIGNIHIKSIVEQSEIPSLDDGSGTHRRMHDFTINYEEE
jgi:hypothetical protein